MTEQHKCLILIADESVDTFTLISNTMGDEFACKHVSDGASVTSLCSLLSPDLLLINSALPDASGFEIVSKLDALSTAITSQIIFLLNNPDAEQEIKAFAHGAADVIHKPLNPDLLRVRLQHCLATKLQHDQQANLISLRTVELEIVNKKLVSLIEERQQSPERDDEDAELAKSRFLANMSHEFRTPLNGIMGILQILRDTDISPEQANLLEMALNSSEHLLRMVNELLELSKIERTGLALKEGCHCLRDELQPLHAIFSLQAHWKGLEYHHSIDPNIPEKIVYDNSSLRHVVVNVLDNALRFTEQGSISFTVQEFSHENAAHLGYASTQSIRLPALLFSISDTGIGISEQKLGTISKNSTLVKITSPRNSVEQVLAWPLPGNSSAKWAEPSGCKAL